MNGVASTFFPNRRCTNVSIDIFYLDFINAIMYYCIYMEVSL